MTPKPPLELGGTVLDGRRAARSGSVLGAEEAIPGAPLDLRQVAAATAAFRAEVKLWTRLLAVAIGVTVLAAGMAIAWCVRLEGKIAALETGWNTRLITELMYPKSQEELRASLATLNAQVETARAHGIPPNPLKLHAFALSVSKLIAQRPDFPEAWQAAAQLVSYRRAGTPGQNGCDGPAAITAVDSDRQQQVVLNFHDCEIALDDFLAGEDAGALPADSRAVLELKNVHVIYRGGLIAHIRSIVLSNCSFDFEMDRSPSPPGLLLTETLLSAEDIRNVTVNLQSPQE